MDTLLHFYAWPDRMIKDANSPELMPLPLFFLSAPVGSKIRRRLSQTAIAEHLVGVSPNGLARKEADIP